VKAESMSAEAGINTEVMTSIIFALCAVTKMKLDLPDLRALKDLQARMDRRGLANANIK
uniref:Cytochrome P450 n=1 Tax=Globodera pallida TaxID=36090 RepID=A0A183CEP6_GLOPA